MSCEHPLFTHRQEAPQEIVEEAASLVKKLLGFSGAHYKIPYELRVKLENPNSSIWLPTQGSLAGNHYESFDLSDSGINGPKDASTQLWLLSIQYNIPGLRVEYHDEGLLISYPKIQKSPNGHHDISD